MEIAFLLSANPLVLESGDDIFVLLAVTLATMCVETM